MADNARDASPTEIAYWAYQAEVEEFNEAGGMMDHFSTACGHLIYLESKPKIKVEFLKPQFGTFVLGDSLEPKDTVGILKWVKGGMLEILSKIQKVNPNFELTNTSLLEIVEFKDQLSKEEMQLLKGNVSDRDILRQAYTMLSGDINHQQFGDYLTQHHQNLNLAKRVSTPKIEGMISAALYAGALGAKINGSGGGGCMFAYAPDNPEKVADAIEKAGGKAFLISIDEGMRIEH